MAKKYFLLLVAFFALYGTCIAEDIYIAQTAAGNNNMSSCANAQSISWLNTSGNWGAGAGKVSAGDTVHLCGTFTTALTVQGSGSNGSPITILFEYGAKFSTAYFPNTGAIGGAGKSYIVVDGGTNGIIENTNNGSAGSYTNQQSSAGAVFTTASNIEVKNLSILNMYVRTVATDYSAQAFANVASIYMTGGSNLSIHDCIMTYGSRFVTMNYIGAASNYSFYNNTITHGNGALWSGNLSANSTLDGLYIYNNTMNLGPYWSFPSGEQWHGEFLHPHTQGGANSYIHNMKIYNNTFGPQVPMKTDVAASATTAWIFDEAKGDNHWIYNNLLIADPGYDATDGLINRSGSAVGTGMKIYNNTIVKLGSQGKNAITIGYPGDTDLEIKNNLIKNMQHGVFTPSTLGIISKNQIAYNVYYGVSNWGVFTSWASWKAAGYDPNSSNGVLPSLDANYVPIASDTVAKDKGVMLPSYFTTDKNSNPRPRGYGWDIGAYAYPYPEPPRNLSIQ